MASRNRRGYARCIFLPNSHRENLPAGAMVHDVSSYADEPFCQLSPLYAHGGIPVPGMPGQTSDSVEGIWQGLKVIRGQTAPRYFRGKGKKRGGKPAGHRFGERLLDLVEARYRIYCPSYEWMLANRIDPGLLESFIERAFAGEVQHFHDTGDNGDVNNTAEPLAHAAVLVQYLNRRCEERARQES
jgi:hypothetical protein